MGGISWEGRRVGPADLFGAAREAQDRGWLDGPARQFLHHCGVCLATDRPLAGRERVALDAILYRLRQLGSSVIATIAADAPARAPGGAAADGLAALEADLAALRLLLASAGERVEAYWEQVQRLRAGAPPDAHPLA